MKRILPFAALALAMPLQAITTQETLTALAQYGQTAVAADVKARIERCPALACLPAKSEGFIAITGISKMLSDLPAVIPPLLSVRDVAVSIEESSAEQLEQAMVIMNYMMQARKDKDTLSKVIDSWKMAAKPEIGQIIADSYESSSTEIKHAAAAALSKLDNITIPAIYCAITAEPGKEEEFARFYEELADRIKYADENGSPSESGGWIDAKRTLPLSLPGIDDVKVTKTIHTLLRKVDNAIIYVVCEKPENVSLPTNVADTLAASDKVSKADEHLSSLIATAWGSPALSNLYLRLSYDYGATHVVLKQIEKIFRDLSQNATPDQETYKTAADSVARISAKLHPTLPETKKPVTLQVWKGSPKDYCFSLSMDAMTLQYEPGTLKHTSRLQDPNTIIYLETTASTSGVPSSIDTSADTYFNISKGITCTLIEELQDDMSGKLQVAELFKPDVQAVGSALETVLSGLEAPASFIVSNSSADATNIPASMLIPGVAITAAVKDRSALAKGWDQLIAAANAISQKANGPADLAPMLPIVPRTLSGAVTNYVLALPFLPVKVEPQVAVSDKQFMISTSNSLTEQLVEEEAGAGVPFCGTVASFRVAPLAEFFRSRNVGGPTQAFEALDKHVEGFYYTFTVKDGSFFVNGQVETK